MIGSGKRISHRWRWIQVVYAACLFCLVAIAGQGWRAWRIEQRGLERRRVPGVERRPGINVELTQYGSEELGHVLRDVASLGFYWVRQRFPWHEIEPKPGVYRWERWDRLVQAVRDYDLGLIAVLDAPPGWARAGAALPSGEQVPLPCVPPYDEEAYARFAAAFAQRYTEAIDHYQVWDEPNLSRSWGGGHVQPCAYAVLLGAAYPAIHAADPSAWVLAGGLAPTQAPGPDNLDDGLYLRQFYAAGGGPYYDILAAKAYGFWSGPEDRRVAPEVLNYSRVIALREWMQAFGDGDKPVWAVEWGWNVLPREWTGELPPWGGDALSVQQSRILEAVVRAWREWPWMGAMCWAAYQPDDLPTSARWGFALRQSDGSASALRDVLRSANRTALMRAPEAALTSARWPLLIGVLLVAGVFAGVLWRRLGCASSLRQVWRWWASVHPGYHVCGLVALGVLYAITPALEWVLIELVLMAALLYLHPQWALIGAVFGIPFFYAAKPLGVYYVAPSETFLVLALLVVGLRTLRSGRWPAVAGRFSALDLVWLLWVALSALSLVFAADPLLARREWWLCVLGPALLYFLLRLDWPRDPVPASCAKTRRSRRRLLYSLLLAWVLSGVAVALIGIVQWIVGMAIPAGGVERVASVYFSPNHMALYLERIWPLALALGLGGSLPRRWERGAWAMALIIGAGLYLTYSRGAWLLAVPMSLLLLGSSTRRSRRWELTFGGTMVLGLAAIGVLCGRQMDASGLLDEVRVPVWRSTIEMIADHPWLGVGLGAFQHAYPRYMRAEAWTEPVLYHPHNVWLDAAVRLGLPGLAVYVALVGLCLYGAVRKLRTSHLQAGLSPLRRALYLGLAAGLVAALAHGMVDSGYFLADLAWSTALVAAIVGQGGALVVAGDVPA